MQEIDVILERSEEELAVLQKELAGAASEKEALRILRAISEQKRNTEVAILRVQIRHARQAGNEEAALRMEQAVEKILNPQPVAPGPEAIRERDARQAGGGNHE